MNEMVGQVALALMEEGGLSATAAHGLARIAIAAMREPTEAMIEARYDQEPPDQPIDKHSAVAVWQAMIDAALKETK